MRSFLFTLLITHPLWAIPTPEQENYKHTAMQPMEVAQAPLSMQEVKDTFRKGLELFKSKGQYNQAFKAFKFAAEQGYAPAEYALGCCYQEGRGIPQNHQKAAEWFEKAANQGNVLAQRALALLRR